MSEKDQKLSTRGAIRAHDGHFLAKDTENSVLKFHWNKDDPLNEKQQHTTFRINQNGELHDDDDRRVIWKSKNEKIYWIKVEQLGENEYVLRTIDTENSKVEKYITINIEDLELKDEPEAASIFTIITNNILG
ncbi:11418_t:CDS:2 [Funneliformis geosporum]|uniref:13269_t:CDS:1 n=1 Tax=Funneliformis geosporum TaxID=1117311 RepID=A0A9W4ST20_9GLOM|nr:13269_t:CDS:2 [Funneliformis geosporum]CAI2182057.1 11418_t:CDS:2 [Funneliformis geosporum]